MKALIILPVLLALGCTRSAPPAAIDPPTPQPLRQTLPTLPPATATFAPPTATPIPARRVQSGDHALFTGDWETAIDEYENAYNSSADPEIQAAALLGIARARWLDGNEYESSRTLERLLTEFPESGRRADAYLLLADIHDAANRYPEAADSYTQYLRLRPGLIDAYVHDWRGDAFFNAANYPAAAADFQAALENPSSLEPDLLRLKMARSYALAGDTPTALLIYADLYDRTSDENTRSLIDLRKAEIYTQLGQTEQAHAAYLDAVQNYPTSYNAYTALVALVDAGVAVDELQRGIIDYHAEEYGVAQAAFDRYLQNNPADPGSALYYYGLCQRALGANQGAIQYWDELIRLYPEHTYWDDAWEQKAFTQWAYLELYGDAVTTLLGFTEAAPDHVRVAEFLYDAAQVSERDNQLEKAIEFWGRVARDYAQDERAGRALFLMGMAQFRLEDYQNAIDSFGRILALNGALSERAAAQLWIGKSQRALGDEAAAKAALDIAAEIDPTGYYSVRARDLMFNRPVFDPPTDYDFGYDLQRERRRAEDWLRQTFGLPADTDLSGPGSLVADPGIVRGAELWNLGLHDQARAEFEMVRQAAAADPVLSYRLANYLIEIGAYRPAIMAARNVLDLAGLSDADTFSAPVYFNHVRFGTYYGEIVLPLAESYRFHPLLLFSIIRQESLFEGFVRSSAGAHGLMQIIPSTGDDIARDLGWPESYSADDLARPIVNLTFGVDYLDTQVEAFDGDLYAALAAYNAGPGNASVWLRLAKGDPDLFLEIIRFSETRDYIRGVYELFTIYRLLYDRSI